MSDMPWIEDATYTLKDGRMVRCLLSSKVPVVNGKYPIPVVRAGWVSGAYIPQLGTYLGHLGKTGADYFRITNTGRGDIRLFVLESDWKKINEEENEFGPVTP